MNFGSSEVNFNDIVKSDAATDNNGLSDFKTIDTSINIDSISAKDCQTSHVNIVKDMNIDNFTHERSNRDGDDDLGATLISQEQRNGSDSGKDELISPSKVHDIITETQEDTETDGKECGKVFNEEIVREIEFGVSESNHIHQDKDGSRNDTQRFRNVFFASWGSSFINIFTTETSFFGEFLDNWDKTISSKVSKDSGNDSEDVSEEIMSSSSDNSIESKTKWESDRSCHNSV